MKNGRIFAVGLGPGAREHMTQAALEALHSSQVVAGYGKYLDMVGDLLEGKRCIRSGMGAETERCRQALEAAAGGETVAVVSSGDAGILAMAGLLFELRTRESRFSGVVIDVIPGITAATAAAAVLGAPLQNGACLLNLSDLLTPADEIVANATLLAATTMSCALYNPAGRKRRSLLSRVLALFLEKRGGECPCAVVWNALRPGERKWVGALSDFPESEIDMNSLVLIGGPRAVIRDGRIYEERGYASKWSE